MRRRFQFSILTMLIFTTGSQAQVEVTTLLNDVKASGGVTRTPNFQLVISDFGSALDSQNELTKVYQLGLKNGAIQVFGEGFIGASGAYFDEEGNFYQAYPKGHKISKRAMDYTWNMDWMTIGIQTLLVFPETIRIIFMSAIIIKLGGAEDRKIIRLIFDSLQW